MTAPPVVAESPAAASPAAFGGLLAARTGAPVRALGLMSGTSLDGVDAAVIETDGETVRAQGGRMFRPYPADLRDALRGLLGRVPGPEAVGPARAMTDFQAGLANDLIAETGCAPAVIGFHGQTVWHDPSQRLSCQIGVPDRLARATGVPVVADLRAADIAAGGQGAPLAPAYHLALAADLERPLAVLNLGGVGNVTYIGETGRVVAFDTGPGNALLDDWARRHTGAIMDENGLMAARGQVDAAVLQDLLDNPFFDLPPPKSIDRLTFRGPIAPGLSAENGAATLCAFTAEAVARAVPHMPSVPKRWIVCGGGRRNPSLMRALEKALAAPVAAAEDAAWDGDFLEAQAFAFLAVRSLRGLPVSFPETTGAPAPLTGGRLVLPA